MYLGAFDPATAVKRFGVVHSDTGAVESGACYAGCSLSNIPACRPMTFPSQAAFNQAAQAAGEWPVILGSAIADSPQWNDLRNQAFSMCATAPAPAAAVAAPAPAPAAPATIIIQQPSAPAPTASGGTFQVPVRQQGPLPAVQQPPIVITGGGGTPVAYGPQQPTAAPAAGGAMDYLPWVVGGGLVLLLLARR